MSYVIYGSFGLLCGLVVFQAYVLVELVRQVVELKRLAHESGMSLSEATGLLELGTPMPAFSAREPGGGRSLGHQDLRGHPTILLFVSVAQAELPAYRELPALIQGFQHRADGHVFMLCEGSEADCVRLAREHEVPIPVFLDDGGAIRGSCGIEVTPSAVKLDEEVRITSYGRSRPHQEVEELRARQQAHEDRVFATDENGALVSQDT